MAQAEAPSIRGMLVRRLMVPLLVLTLCAGLAAWALARHFTQMVLDQWLLDAAMSLASRVVRDEAGRVGVDLPEGARAVLEADVVDQFFYQVSTARGVHLVGNADLPAPPARREAEKPAYYDGVVDGLPVRVLSLELHLRDEPVHIRVAETLNKRNTVSQRVLLIGLLVSLVLTAVAAALSWHAIAGALRSMERAVRAVRSRHASAPLEPVPPGGDVPRELSPLLDEINDLIRSLSDAHQLNHRFVADAAHQLRTPLATLRVRLETARREQDPKLRSRALDEAAAAVARMGHLLHQLLTLARADGEGTQSMDEVDIDRIAREEIERHVDHAVARGVDLGYVGCGRPVLVTARAGLLHEAVSNLVDNALRYAASGRQVTVGVAGAPPQIYVEDHGPGIPPEERQRVRDRFYRRPGSPGEGCGLGLAIVEEIARRFGASLILEDAAGKTGLRARLVFGREAAGQEGPQPVRAKTAWRQAGRPESRLLSTCHPTREEIR